MTTRSRTLDRSGGKPATNRLSYGAAILTSYKDTNYLLDFLLEFLSFLPMISEQPD
jgi:hypothetical protein